MDLLAFYDQETYIFNEVRSKFQKDGSISAYDFFCIVIWKANRAKTKIARKLLKHTAASDLDTAVRQLTIEINKAPTPKDKLRLLMESWKFQLPMASAILTVLYPDEFTVYDVRVCNELNDFHKIGNVSTFERIWLGYCQYKNAVIAETPGELSLRNKDRYLWARSFSKQLQADIQRCFNG